MSQSDWVTHNRMQRNWSRREMLLRVLWAAAAPLFSFSPRPLWGWRRVMLRAFGAKVGEGAHIYPSVRITMPWNVSIGIRAAIGDRAILYALGPISIADRATVSQGAHLCAGTHDIRHPERPLVKAPIEIGPDAWICADAFVGPSVCVGAGAIVGARAVVMKAVASGSTVVGNPARPLEKGPQKVMDTRCSSVDQIRC